MRKRRGFVAVVPVRAGSKGLPGKNIRELAGKPLYLHAVLQGLRFADQCIISTDIPEILSSSPPDQTLVLKRPDEHSSDQSTMSDVIKNIILELKLTTETILLLQATSPLRSDCDIQSTLDLYENNTYEMVMTVAPAKSDILKYGMIKGHKYYPVSNPEYCFENRQNLPEVFRHNGAVYAFGASDFIKQDGIPTQNIGTVVMPEDRSVDIDTASDFDFVEKLFC